MHVACHSIFGKARLAMRKPSEVWRLGGGAFDKYQKKTVSLPKKKSTVFLKKKKSKGVYWEFFGLVCGGMFCRFLVFFVVHFGVFYVGENWFFFQHISGVFLDTGLSGDFLHIFFLGGVQSGCFDGNNWGRLVWHI